METVLGLSVSTTNVQSVLVEGRDADGVTLEHDEFDAFAGAMSAARASDQVAEAVLSIASADGHRLQAIGVTWSEDADLEASLVLHSLADLGFDNVVAVRLPRAAEALACSIGRVIGYQRTAVCVVEPAAVVLSLVDTFGGEVETLVNRSIGADGLLDWVASVFARDEWRPEGLFLVGSVSGLGTLAARLEQGLELPVFDPPEADLALAHGAALASAHGHVDELGPAYGYPDFAPTPDTRRALMVPAGMLVGGAVTFVVAVALAVSPQLLPERDRVPADNAQVQADVPVPAAPLPPPAAPLPAEPAEAPVVVDPPAEAPPAPVIDEAPAYPPAPVEAAPPAPAAEPPAQFEQMIPPAPPPVAYVPPPVVVPQVPAQPPRLRDRIRDKIPGLNRFGD